MRFLTGNRSIPDPRKAFYGWYIVGAGAVNSFLTSGFGGSSLGILILPIHEETGWTIAAISVGFAIRNFELGFMSPIAGYVIDRFGPRPTSIFGMVIAALGLLALSQARDLWLYYASAVLIATGQTFGALSPFAAAIVSWFYRKRGRAIGLLNSGNGSGYLGVLVISGLMTVMDWRTAVMLLAAIILVVGVPMSMVLRTRPEDMGLVPDGEEDRTSEAQSVGGRRSRGSAPPPPPPGTGLSVAEALHTPAFWFLIMAQASTIAGVQAWTTQQIPHLQNVGFSVGTAAVIVAIYGGVQLILRTSSGWLGDMFGRRRLYIISFFFLAIGLYIFATMDAERAWLLPLYYILWGSGMATWVVLGQAIAGDYFGTYRYGTIRGLMSSIGVPLGALSPVVAGIMFDRTGSFQLIFIIYALVMATGGFWIIAIRRPYWAEIQAARDAGFRTG